MNKALCAIISALLFGSVSLQAGQLILTTTDFTTGNTAMYDTDTQVFNGNIMGLDDQDSLVETDGESVYFIHRGLGSITKYNLADIGVGQPVYQYSVGAASNPYDIVFLEQKAYVIRYGAGDILIIDPNAPDAESFELGAIDLSAFDTDGIPDMVYGYEWNGMVYVVLQRLHNYESDMVGYLVAIDPATDTVIDLDTGTPGVQGVELLVKNPQFFSQVDGTAYIGGHALYVQTEGVQSVDLNDPAFTQTMLIEEATYGKDVSDICVINDSLAYVCSSTWIEETPGSWIKTGAAYWFDPLTGTVGDQLPVPTPNGNAVSIEGTLYVPSGDYGTPGLYPIDPLTNTLAGDVMYTTLRPNSMVYLPDSGISDVTETAEAPSAFMLDAPYPNPFNPSVTIPFTLTQQGMVEASVYAITGQKVATLAADVLSPGSHQLVWHAGSSGTGVYVVRISHDGMVQSVNVTLMK